MKIILASASPRRRELLERTGLSFSVIPSQEEERITKTKPEEIVEELALVKAASVAAKQEDDCLVIGSDTIVVQDGKILGKPRDESQAAEMLRSLQGRTHQVYTGVALLYREGNQEEKRIFHEAVDVAVYPMTEEEILAYVATGEPMDKAGAYGIQGKFCVFIRGIRGDYNTVVGFPVGRFAQEIKKLPFDFFHSRTFS
ncbi:MAG: Maf family protein [Blautia sp.]